MFNIIKIMKRSGGFTLIEVIVSLVVAAVLGTMLVSFFGTGVMQSVNPVIVAHNGAYLNAIMERMNADYKYQMATARINLQTAAQGYALFNNASFGAEGTQSSKYSDASHPYTVLANHTITFSSASPATETAASSKLHKVTIEYQNLRATTLFSE